MTGGQASATPGSRSRAGAPSCDSPETPIFIHYNVLMATRSDLEPAVQTAGDGDALAGLARAAEGLLQRLQCALVLLELLDEGVHRLLRPLLLLVSLRAQTSLNSSPFQ